MLHDRGSGESGFQNGKSGSMIPASIRAENIKIYGLFRLQINRGHVLGVKLIKIKRLSPAPPKFIPATAIISQTL
jgi:hypothetical protein